MKDEEKRRIRSFVRREGRITPKQQRAFTQLWQHYGAESSDGILVLPEKREVIFEIGFGMGQSLFEMAALNPNAFFIGVEVHRPGVGTLINSAEEAGLNNIKVFCEDANIVLKQSISDQSLDRINIFFPDPWHKKRHNKRRLIQSQFIKLLYTKLKPGGLLHLATDWQDYAEQMMAVMTDANGFSNIEGSQQFHQNTSMRPKTKFEKRGERLGHGVWDLIFKRT